MAFKTFADKALFDEVYDKLEAVRHDEPNANKRNERECPHCAELILRKATVCKHCGGNVLSALI